MRNTLFIGKVYHRFDELPSTNDYSLELLAKSEPAEGTVVQTANQSAGRGQFGASWESEPAANVLLSVILYPTMLPAAAQFRLGMVAALAVRDTVAELLAPFQLPSCPLKITIKWPNDVYINDKKTAGILIQNVLKGQYIKASVIGIGLNVNQTTFSAAANPASLHTASGHPFSIDVVTELLLTRLEQRYLLLRSNAFDFPMAEYLKHLFRFNLPASFQRTADGTVFHGKITGVTETGKLQILLDSALTEYFDIKEIKFI